ncbi:hypothetical protein BGZ63DRAFT_149568 [Mariannaea sp. PMI_226]|nr:hypothetical protein BGZ63DRAFT_149568 [Mariannaea sp. PMI_226]
MTHGAFSWEPPPTRLTMWMLVANLFASFLAKPRPQGGQRGRRVRQSLCTRLELSLYLDSSPGEEFITHPDECDVHPLRRCLRQLKLCSRCHPCKGLAWRTRFANESVKYIVRTLKRSDIKWAMNVWSLT